MTAAKPPTRGSSDDSLPLYDGSYYLIVSRAVQALKNETGVRNKVRGVTRQAAALGTHAKRRFRALSLVGKLATGLLLLAFGAGLAAGGWYLFGRQDPSALRARIRAHMTGGDYLAARDDLDALRALGPLSREDRRELATPLRARLESMAAAIKKKIETLRRGQRWEEALLALAELEGLDVDARWRLFTEAEILRAAAKDSEAAAAYGRFAGLYPDSDQADDALFWQALSYKSRGDAIKARALLEELLTRYPKSNYGTSGRRVLAELGGMPP